MGAMEEPPSRDFKKNRNMSTNSHNGPLTINVPSPNQGYIPPTPGHVINSPTVNNMQQMQQINANMLPPTNPKMNGQYTEPQTPKTSAGVKIGDDHRLIIEGVKLAMDLIESKLPNHMGYAHLILTRTLAIIAEMSNRTNRK